MDMVMLVSEAYLAIQGVSKILEQISGVSTSETKKRKKFI
jgi:TRAP-type mannitol/chloroaromatic compound transport system permease small subunit